MWRALRQRGVGWKAHRQVPIGPFSADFFLPVARLVIEVDGETHGDASRDVARDAWFEARGVRVLRVRNADVMENIEGVLAAIVLAAPPPHPSPPPRGGRGKEGQ